MNKTKIDWCDMTWNPVTGCLHGCEYCYAQRMVNRFGKTSRATGECHEINQGRVRSYHEAAHHTGSYPYGFDPTLYADRLGEPNKHKKPQTIFVCSMADLFGEWVPDKWIREVFDACEAAPQHRYLFLTKNPDRYYQLGDGDEKIIPDGGIRGWFGASATTEEQAQDAWKNTNCTWMSIEPLHGEFSEEFFTHTAMAGDGMVGEVQRWNWIVVGAESGTNKSKVIPKREWIESIMENCRATNTPIFMKESLRALMGDDFIQEYPWES